jgi:hypothetical protein
LPTKANLAEIEATARYEIRYHSRRSQVWHWYWKQWRTRLWRIQALIAAIIVIFTYVLLGDTVGIEYLLPEFITLLLIVTTLSAAWPQIKFKNNNRILKIGPEGWATHIGQLSGARSWVEVATVHEIDSAVSIVGVNGNALIIPRYALASTGEWERFLTDVKTWHSLRNS